MLLDSTRPLLPTQQVPREDDGDAGDGADNDVDVGEFDDDDDVL